MDAIEKRAREIRDKFCQPGDYDYSDILDAIIAALTPTEGHVVVTRDEDGEIVMVSRQNDDHDVLEVIALTTHAGSKPCEYTPPKDDMGNPISVPDGFVLVPVDTTIEKLRAMMDHSFGGPGFVVYGTAQSIAEIERRMAPMLSARPEVPNVND